MNLLMATKARQPQQQSRTRMTTRKVASMPNVPKKLKLQLISLSFQYSPLGQAHSPTMRAASPGLPNQRA